MEKEFNETINENYQGMDETEKALLEVQKITDEYAKKMSVLVEENHEKTRLNFLLVATGDYKDKNMVIACNSGKYDNLLRSMIFLASPNSPLNEKAEGLYARLFNDVNGFLLFEKLMDAAKNGKGKGTGAEE